MNENGNDAKGPWGIPPADVRQSLSPERRQRWKSGARRGAPASSWECFDDDTVLAWLDALPANHGRDDQLIEIVRSERHFYVRQKAAQKVTDPDRLEVFAADRSIGRILALRLSRADDAEYLGALIRDSRHPGVRAEAQAQLAELTGRLAAKQEGPRG